MRISRSAPLAALAAAAVTLAGCSGEPAADEPTSIVIATAVGQLATNFYPPTSPMLFWMTTEPVYEPLVKWDDEKAEFVPWLAKEFEISEDGYTISLTLREDVDFVDGEHLTAQGVVDAFNYYVTVDSIAGADKPVASVTGEYTLDIVTEKPTYPDAGFLTFLSLYPIVSPAAYDDTELLATEPVGTGPYLLDEVVPEVSVSYVRNPDYWNPDAFDFDEVTIVPFADKVAALNALKSGQIDAAEIDFGLAAEAEASGFRLNEGPSGFNGLIITDREGTVFAPTGDQRVRQALALAFDRETITEDLELGYGRVSSQPFTSGTSDYVEGGDDRYAYDPERARELLAEAGYPDGFTLPLPSEPFNPYAAIDYRPIIEQYLGEIGVTVEWVELATDPAERGQQIENLVVPAIYGFNAYSNTIAHFVVAVGAGKQPVEDTVFVELLADYESGTQAEHADALPDLTEYILDQAWYVPVSHPQVLWATRSDISAAPSSFPYPLPSFDMFRLVD